ncbi:unnamed protein product [Tenebrio molitor]|nr:unnamed protein product [Tenebrio molitor]
MLKSSLKVKENLCIEKFGSVTANCLPQTDKCGTSCEKIEVIQCQPNLNLLKPK